LAKNLGAILLRPYYPVSDLFEEGLTLVTRNRRHFGMIEGLSLLVP
jgi:hypothetical protein